MFLLHQVMALIYKNILQHRQAPFALLLRTFGPLLSVLMIFSISKLLSSFQTGSSFGQNSIPQLLNIPGLYQLIQGQNADCVQFYSLSYNKSNVTQQQFESFKADIQEGWPSLSCVSPFVEVNDSNSHIMHIFDQLNHNQFIPGKPVAGLQKLPDGDIQMTGPQSFKIMVNDNRIPEYHRSNGLTKLSFGLKNSGILPYLRVSQGLIQLQDLLVKSMLSQKDFMLISAISYMPSLQNKEFSASFKIVEVLSVFLLGLTFALPFPSLLSTLVLDKEERVLQIATVNGMTLGSYFISYVICEGAIILISLSSTFMLMKALLSLSYVSSCSMSTFLGITLFFEAQLVLLGFVVSRWLQSSKLALLVGYMVTFWSTFLGIALNSIVYAFPEEMGTGAMMFPFMSFQRLFYKVVVNSFYDNPLSSLLSLDSESRRALGVLAFQNLTLVLITVKILWIGRYSSQLSPTRSNFSADQLLVCYNLLKVYPSQSDSDLVALDLHSLAVNRQEIFALIGPNGAGKSTFFNILAGLVKPTRGSIFLQNQSLLQNKELIKQGVGICPQFDLHWKDLSVEDHIRFFFRLKGRDQTQLQSAVDKSIQDLHLQPHRHTKAGVLSGGMRRRLSIAISLIGSPSLVLMDEPSTGLDPQNKRALWKIIRTNKKERSLVISTHSMQQAELLCDRLGVLVAGKLRFEGRLQQFKDQFGGGLRFKFQVQERDRLQKLIREVEKELQGELMERGGERATMRVWGAAGVVRWVRGRGVRRWSVRTTSLEECFLEAINQFSKQY